ncbi:hypothetical protein DO70_5294 [Burkholderia pseudomallei]|nr:hypothetical protein DO70_5294 [Burkholderia pseudomallei]
MRLACSASSSCASFTDSARCTFSWLSASVDFTTCRFSSISFSTPSNAFVVRPKRLSMLAFWAAAICSGVSKDMFMLLRFDR